MKVSQTSHFKGLLGELGYLIHPKCPDFAASFALLKDDFYFAYYSVHYSIKGSIYNTEKNERFTQVWLSRILQTRRSLQTSSARVTQLIKCGG